jgi:hypothetical protein
MKRFALPFFSLAGACLAAAPGQVDFSREVRPILSENCFQCHGPDEKARKAGRRLDTLEGALAEKEGVRAVVPGDPGKSELLARVGSSDPEEVMPPPKTHKKVMPAQAEILRRWIEQGAAWGKHWAYEAPIALPPPAVKEAGRVRNPVDNFVLARLEREGLPPAPEADRRTLLRRVSLDLTGLPPSLEEVEAFVADSAPDAYERQVDRLLASPRFGERMALEWLDAAHYADTNGYFSDKTRQIWPWRDWVIQAFNANMPFDRFTIEQLAGDLLPEATTAQRVATGFNRNHMVTNESGVIDEEYRVEYVADRTETTATVWLGSTIACCRCHDHKFDPFKQKEYYQLFSFFNNVPEKGLAREDDPPPVLELAPPAEKAELVRLQNVQRLREALWAPVAKRIAPEMEAWEKSAPAIGEDEPRRALMLRPENRKERHREALMEYYLRHEQGPDALAAWLAARDARKLAEAKRATLPRTLVMEELPRPREAHVLKRGVYDAPADPVQPGVPACLPPMAPDAPRNRLGLARWLVAPENPLTARVEVNRLWQVCFGEGLVRTMNDFGSQGDPPTHPELLDFLAVRLHESGWDVKALLRLLVTSATYRQSSVPTPALLARDPDNRLLARGPRFRLSAECVRDQALAASGLLVERLGGPSVKPYQPPGLWEAVSYDAELTYQADAGEGLWRRSLYTFWKRQSPPPSLLTFDGPTRETCVVRRARTDTPLQALVLLNDRTYVEAAQALAARAQARGATFEEQARDAFERVTARPPTGRELGLLRQLFDRETQRLAGTGPAWTAVAQVILNLDETITRR